VTSRTAEGDSFATNYGRATPVALSHACLEQ
jgi:hypothetical protein